MLNRKEGFIDVSGNKIWYETVGDTNKNPLLIVHGGPGYPHDSLESLADLADERQVIFYDQLECGNSQKVSDKSHLSLEYYTHELQEIIRQLKLTNYHILGHSWGTALALNFALNQPAGLKSLILSDPFLNASQFEKDAARLIKELPPEMQKAVEAGDTASVEFQTALKEFTDRHFWRTSDLPDPCLRAEHKMNVELYNYMWGLNEFKATGPLKDFDLTGRLKEISMRVLLLCGRYDQSTPETTTLYKNQIPNSQMVVFENSAHMPMWTERQAFMKTARSFLSKVDSV